MIENQDIYQPKIINLPPSFKGHISKRHSRPLISEEHHDSPIINRNPVIIDKQAGCNSIRIYKITLNKSQLNKGLNDMFINYEDNCVVDKKTISLNKRDSIQNGSVHNTNSKIYNENMNNGKSNINNICTSNPIL